MSDSAQNSKKGLQDSMAVEGLMQSGQMVQSERSEEDTALYKSFSVS